MSLRRSARVLVLLAFTALPFVACSSGSSSGTTGAPLDCAWVKDPNNCWRTYVASIDACLGHSAEAGTFERGTFSADAKTCTYENGRRVESRTLPLTDDANKDAWDFVVTQGGKTCLDFKEVGQGFTVKSDGKTFSYGLTGSVLTLTCADGKVYSGDGTALLSCLDLSGGMPGTSYSGGGTSQSFTLLGMTDPAFSCSAGPTPGGDSGTATSDTGTSDGGTGD